MKTADSGDGAVVSLPRSNHAGILKHGRCGHTLASLLIARMVLGDVAQAECAAGCGHRLYSGRGPIECPCYWALRRLPGWPGRWSDAKACGQNLLMCREGPSIGLAIMRWPCGEPVEQPSACCRVRRDSGCDCRSVGAIGRPPLCRTAKVR